MQFVNIGFGNLVNADKILAMVTPDSAPAKRLVQNAKEEGRLIDATQGRRTRGILVMEEGSMVLSSLLPETVASRVGEKTTAGEKTAAGEKATAEEKAVAEEEAASSDESLES